MNHGEQATNPSEQPVEAKAPITWQTGTYAAALVALSIAPFCAMLFNDAREAPIVWVRNAVMAIAAVGSVAWITIAVVAARDVLRMPAEKRRDNLWPLVIVAAFAYMPVFTILISIPYAMLPTAIAVASLGIALTPFLAWIAGRASWNALKTVRGWSRDSTIRLLEGGTTNSNRHKFLFAWASATTPIIPMAVLTAGLMLYLVPDNLLLSNAVSFTTIISFFIGIPVWYLIAPKVADATKIGIALAIVGSHAGTALGATVAMAVRVLQ